MKLKSGGFGIIEIIVAIGIFIIIAGVAASSILGGLSINRLGGEETNANAYAQEGIEAVRSIKNQGWSNLVIGTHGIDKSTGKWIFSGTSNTQDKFTRQIVISSVQRDSLGNIIVSGGTIDPDTFKVDSRVTWNFSSIRSNSVTLTTYLSHWEKLIPASSPTPTPTTSPSPTPTPNSCPTYCQTLSYQGGNCRQNSNQCTSNGEIYQSGGNIFCTVNPNKSCCCIPTPLPTATPTPTPVPTPANCNQYCQATYSLPGSCVKSKDCSGQNAGKIYECSGSNICCCQ